MHREQRVARIVRVDIAESPYGVGPTGPGRARSSGWWQRLYGRAVVGVTPYFGIPRVGPRDGVRLVGRLPPMLPRDGIGLSCRASSCVSEYFCGVLTPALPNPPRLGIPGAASNSTSYQSVLCSGPMLKLTRPFSRLDGKTDFLDPVPSSAWTRAIPASVLMLTAAAIPSAIVGPLPH